MPEECKFNAAIDSRRIACTGLKRFDLKCKPLNAPYFTTRHLYRSSQGRPPLKWFSFEKRLGHKQRRSREVFWIIRRRFLDNHQRCGRGLGWARNASPCHCSAKRKNGFASASPVAGRSYFTPSSILFRQRHKEAEGPCRRRGPRAPLASFHNIVLPAASGYTVNIFRRCPDWKILSHSLALLYPRIWFKCQLT